MKNRTIKLFDRFIALVPAMVIIVLYVLMIFIIADFKISMLLLIGGLLMGLVMGAMDVNFFPLRPVVVMYTLASVATFIYIIHKGGKAGRFSAEDIIVVVFFLITILMMLLISITKADNPSNYIIKIIIDWYGVILLFVFLFALYYFECRALIDGNGEVQVSLQSYCYFSCITFTGLGYGDIVTLPEFRMVAAMQAIIGYICMGGVAATIYSLIQSKLQALHKAKRLEEKKENDSV